MCVPSDIFLTMTRPSVWMNHLSETCYDRGAFFGLNISRLGKITIRPNRHFPRFLRPDCSKERKKSIAGRKGLHATFCALPRAWAAPTWVVILRIMSTDWFVRFESLLYDQVIPGRIMICPNRDDLEEPLRGKGFGKRSCMCVLNGYNHITTVMGLT